MGYYLAIKNEDSMNFADKGMELENILSEVIQIPEDMQRSQNVQNTKDTTHRP